MTRLDRRLVVPEVVQTSGMDCGPACLKCLLEGYGISASYGRLREAVQTDVDGTSIDTLEEIAVHLGFTAEQIMVPVDHLLLPEANTLPAIVVVRLPNGFTHFVVVWRTHFNRFVQVMDPATGRRWMGIEQFLSDVYRHTFLVPAAGWREWACTDEFLNPLRQRLANVGVTTTHINHLVAVALADPGWHSLAALDAATRMVAAIVKSGGIRHGPQATRVLDSFMEKTQSAASTEKLPIPDLYWSVKPAEADETGNEQLNLYGAVLVRAGRPPKKRTHANDTQPQLLSPELAAALTEKRPRPAHELLRFLQADGLLTPSTIVAALFLSAGGVVVEALLLRGLFELGQSLNMAWQRLGAMLAILLFAILMLLLRLQIIRGTVSLGRHLEVRLRLAFLEKIPRLRDQYFRSRPVSDMAQRSHAIYRLRHWPGLSSRLLLAIFTLFFTAVGLVWITPASAWLVVLTTVLIVTLPLLLQPALSEREMRARTHTGALSRFFLDSLLGLVPIRTHGAETAIQREHGALLSRWSGASVDLYRAVVSIEGVQLFLGYGLTIWLLFDYLQRGGNAAGILLLVYWLLTIPVLAQEISMVVRQYPIQRNITLRLLEPLGASEDETVDRHSSPNSHLPGDNKPESCGGAAIHLEEVNVILAGHTVLRDVSVSIGAGEHVAVVGPSGAGKTTLVGLLLGWYRAATGCLLVDGATLDGASLSRLRHTTAWVDPTVQLWNQSFLANLHYGNLSFHSRSEGQVVEQAGLLSLLRKLPNGWHTVLGESGGLVSGGEGQRVRLARAMLRQRIRLVILDEPFRGLDRTERSRLLQEARRLWSDATLLCITHDLSETKSFDRVLVLENGRLVESGAPAALLQRPDSRYGAFLETDTNSRQKLWSAEKWRKLRLEEGKLVACAETEDF